VAALLLLAACRVDTRVDVTVNADGSGTVHTTLTFDDEAMARLGGVAGATQQVPVADLQRAGWNVSGWVRTANGTSVTLSHPFHGQADLSARLADLVGPGGMLRDPRLTHERGWFRSHDDLSMVVDLRSPQTGIGSDADLRARMRAAGLDPATLDAQLTSQLRDALHLTVVLHLPNGQTRSYDASSGSVATVKASESHTDYDGIVQVGIAIALVVLAGLLLLAATVGARRNRRRNAQRVRTPHVEQERAPLM
jgi:hypothetical protein